MSELGPGEHRTVSRITTTLELVARAESGVRLAEIATAVDAPRSSIFGLAKGLEARGYVEERAGRYVLGPAVSALLRRAAPDPARVLQPVLNDLRDEFDETATLSVAVGVSVTYIASAESRQMIKYSTPLRTRRPLYPTSAGKVLLSGWPQKKILEYLKTLGLDDAARDAAVAELADVRKTGIAFNRGETLPEVVGAARLIEGDSGGPLAISVAGPSARTESRLEHIAGGLIHAEERATKLLNS